MDISEIRDLIEMISKSKVSKLELEREGFRLKLEKPKPAAKQKPAVVTVAATPPVAQQMQVVPQAESAPGKAPAAAPAPAPEKVAEPEEEGVIELTSPFVGTFYRAPGPDADPFVDIGTRVKRGQIMCIVEAMKLMNEIEAEMDCEVVDILVTNGQPVEFGEALFKIRPSK